VGLGGYILAGASVVLFLMLGRELWRGLSPLIRQRRDRRRLEAQIEERTEDALRAPGATPDNPVEVGSASVVETRATSSPCPVCGSRVHAERHVVETIGDRRLRVVWLHCRRCGHRRPFYVHIAESPAVH
jgi:hypothetical protein